MSAAKCETCEIYAEDQRCGVPSYCTWYMDNAVLRGIPVKFCTEHRPMGDKVTSKALQKPLRLEEVLPLPLGQGHIEIRNPSSRLWRKYGLNSSYYNKTFRIWERPYTSEESEAVPWEEISID